MMVIFRCSFLITQKTRTMTTFYPHNKKTMLRVFKLDTIKFKVFIQHPLILDVRKKKQNYSLHGLASLGL